MRYEEEEASGGTAEAPRPERIPVSEEAPIPEIIPVPRDIHLDVPIISSRGLAADLTDSLLACIGSDKRDYRPQRHEIPTADVEAAVDRLHEQMLLLHSMLLPFPILITSGEPPIPLDLGFEPYWRDEFVKPSLIRNLLGKPKSLLRGLLASVQRFYAEQDIGCILVPPADAVPCVRSHLENFLTVRFQARQSDISDRPGLIFSVTTHTQGLRVHYSPAYFFNSRTVLGSPTSPAVGWIQPGRYVFGAAAPGKPPVFDLKAHYDVPPATSATLGI